MISSEDKNIDRRLALQCLRLSLAMNMRPEVLAARFDARELEKTFSKLDKPALLAPNGFSKADLLSISEIMLDCCTRLLSRIEFLQNEIEQTLQTGSETSEKLCDTIAIAYDYLYEMKSSMSALLSSSSLLITWFDNFDTETQEQLNDFPKVFHSILDHSNELLEHINKSAFALVDEFRLDGTWCGE